MISVSGNPSNGLLRVILIRLENLSGQFLEEENTNQITEEFHWTTIQLNLRTSAWLDLKLATPSY